MPTPVLESSIEFGVSSTFNATDTTTGKPIGQAAQAKFLASLTLGVNANQANVLFTKDYTLAAGGTASLDLRALTRSVLDQSVESDMQAIRGIVIVNTTDPESTSEGNWSNPATAKDLEVDVKPDGFYFLGSKNSAWSSGTGESAILRFTNLAEVTSTFTVALIGMDEDVGRNPGQPDPSPEPAPSEYVTVEILDQSTDPLTEPIEIVRLVFSEEVTGVSASTLDFRSIVDGVNLLGTNANIKIVAEDTGIYGGNREYRIEGLVPWTWYSDTFRMTVYSTGGTIRSTENPGKVMQADAYKDFEVSLGANEAALLSEMSPVSEGFRSVNSGSTYLSYTDSRLDDIGMISQLHASIGQVVNNPNFGGSSTDIIGWTYNGSNDQEQGRDNASPVAPNYYNRIAARDEWLNFASRYASRRNAAGKKHILVPYTTLQSVRDASNFNQTAQWPLPAIPTSRIGASYYTTDPAYTTGIADPDPTGFIILSTSGAIRDEVVRIHTDHMFGAWNNLTTDGQHFDLVTHTGPDWHGDCSVMARLKARLEEAGKHCSANIGGWNWRTDDPYGVAYSKTGLVLDDFKKCCHSVGIEGFLDRANGGLRQTDLEATIANLNAWFTSGRGAQMLPRGLATNASDLDWRNVVPYQISAVSDDATDGGVTFAGTPPVSVTNGMPGDNVLVFTLAEAANNIQIMGGAPWEKCIITGIGRAYQDYITMPTIATPGIGNVLVEAEAWTAYPSGTSTKAFLFRRQSDWGTQLQAIQADFTALASGSYYLRFTNQRYWDILGLILMSIPSGSSKAWIDYTIQSWNPDASYQAVGGYDWFNFLDYIGTPDGDYTVVSTASDREWPATGAKYTNVHKITRDFTLRSVEWYPNDGYLQHVAL